MKNQGEGMAFSQETPVISTRSDRTEVYMVATLLAVISCIYFLTAHFSEGLGYGGDSFAHYLISRYSWKHPELFFFMWGKPFFTLISSPFTQFGWTGMLMFNGACAILTAYIIYQYCREMKFQHSWMSILLVSFSPVYFRHIPTGLTEPFFAFVLTASAYLFLKRKYAAGSVLVSFLPLVRTEGFGIIPLFLIVLFLRRQFSRVPLLTTGVVSYSILGYFVQGDLFWILKGNYSFESIVYGMKGTLLYYFKVAPFQYGFPLMFLLITGFLHILITVSKKNRDTWQENHYLETLIIMTGSFVVLFSAYVLIWWRGILDVIGDTRYLMTTIPGVVFTAMLGIQLILEWIRSAKILGFLFSILISILSVLMTYREVGFPVKISRESAFTVDASLWLKKNGYSQKKIYYNNPIIPFVLDIDPYNKARMDELMVLRQESPPRGSIIVWDAHFCPNEAKLPIENLLRNPDLVLLKAFIPETSLKTLKGYNFEIYVFMKANEKHVNIYRL